MAGLSTLLPYVHDELPAVPRLVAERALQDAGRVFCYYSTCWRVWLPVINARAGRSAIEIEAEEGEIVAIHKARLDGRKLPVVTEDEADDMEDANVTASRPLRLTVVSPVEVRLIPAPQATCRLELKASIQPARGADEVPDWLAARWGKEIAAGAKELLCLMKDQAWSDSGKAGDYRVEFRSASSRARREIESAMNSAETQVRLRNWV